MAENVDTAEPSATKVATDDVSEPKHQQEEQAKVVTAEAAATPAAAPNPHDQAGAGAAAAASSEAAVNTAKRWFSMGVANFASTAKKVAASAEKIATDVFDDTNDKRASTSICFSFGRELHSMNVECCTAQPHSVLFSQQLALSFLYPSVQERSCFMEKIDSPM